MRIIRALFIRASLSSWLVKYNVEALLSMPLHLKAIHLTEPDSHPLSVSRSDRLGKQPHRIAGISLESCIHSKGLSIQTIFAMSRF